MQTVNLNVKDVRFIRIERRSNWSDLRPLATQTENAIAEFGDGLRPETAFLAQDNKITFLKIESKKEIDLHCSVRAAQSL